MSGLLLRLLAHCRRLLVLLLFAGTLLVAVAYWQMPPLNTLKPEIQGYLKQQLQLKTLDLGDLSWYWAGHLWIRAEGINLEGKHLAYHGTLGIRIPFFRLLMTQFQPNRIRLSGGKLVLHLADRQTPADSGAATSSPATLLPDGELLFDKVEVDWDYNQIRGHFDYMALFFDTSGHLVVSTPDMELQLQLDRDLLPQSLEMTFASLNWLPATMLAYIDTPPQGTMHLQRKGQELWSFRASMSHARGYTLMPHSNWSLPANQLSVQGDITAMAGVAPWRGFERVDITALNWQYGDNTIAATGRWQEGALALQATSSHLDMPLLWQALRPLGDAAEWHQWLASMHAGHIRHAEARISIPWAQPWDRWPEAEALQEGLKYHVQGDVEDVDIALGLNDEKLLHTRAFVELDESGLQADIRRCDLPDGVGTATASLHLPWSTLMLDISGEADADMTQLARWRAPEVLEHSSWQQGDSHASFHVRWPATSARAESVQVTLRPKTQWRLTVHKVPLTATDGLLRWDMQGGVAVEKMRISTGLAEGLLSLSAQRDAAGDWGMQTLHASLNSSLARAAGSFDLPIAGADGTVAIRLDIDREMRGRIDLKNASWKNLLGTTKQAGVPLVIHLRGKVDERNGQSRLSIADIHNEGDLIQLRGFGSIEQQAVILNLTTLQTGAFNGALSVQSPFGNAPWMLDVDARFLDRSALPESVPVVAESKAWKLQARIDRFNWGEAALSGISLQLDSWPGSQGRLKAHHIHTSELDLMNIQCTFVLPGKGLIDVRELKAELEKQRLYLSATFGPEPGGGLSWRGFARVSGDFGHLMTTGGLSERFVGGTMHAMFSGQGIMMREQPWWQGLKGRLRLRVDDGRILEGGTVTKLLALLSLADLPRMLLGQREDLTGPGLFYDRLQMEGLLSDQHFEIYNLAMRATALDMAGRGSLDLQKNTIDLLMIVHPLQNLDAILNSIPLVRDIFGGKSHSLMSKVYHMQGPLEDATIEEASPTESKRALNRVVEGLFALPEKWFGEQQDAAPAAEPGR